MRAGRWSLDEFVEELSLVRASNPREPDAPPEDSANAVKVMTVHSAKGLEFPIVFVAALHKGVDTKLPLVAFSPEFGLGARWRNPVRREEKDDLFQHAIREERKVRERDESHRLLYVAMTRAEQQLGAELYEQRQEAGQLGGRGGRQPGSGSGYRRATRSSTYRTPDGQEWKLRVLVTDRAPEVLARRAGRGPAEESVEFMAPARRLPSSTTPTPR